MCVYRVLRGQRMQAVDGGDVGHLVVVGLVQPDPRETRSARTYLGQRGGMRELAGQAKSVDVHRAIHYGPRGRHRDTWAQRGRSGAAANRRDRGQGRHVRNATRRDTDCTVLTDCASCVSTSTPTRRFRTVPTPRLTCCGRRTPRDSTSSRSPTTTPPVDGPRPRRRWRSCRRRSPSCVAWRCRARPTARTAPRCPCTCSATSSTRPIRGFAPSGRGCGRSASGGSARWRTTSPRTTRRSTPRRSSARSVPRRGARTSRVPWSRRGSSAASTRRSRRCCTATARTTWRSRTLRSTRRWS